MAVMNRPYGYSRIDNEDPEETKHRRAQFLIYKSLQRADSRRRPSWLRVKIFKLKIKIGKRLKKLKRGFSSTILFSAKPDFYRQIACLLKSCKHLLNGKQQQAVGGARNLHPVF